MRIVFMGTPDFAVPTLNELVARGHDLAAVYTQPPKPAGRGLDPRKSPVHATAEAFGIPVFTPKTLRTPEAQADFAVCAPDVAVVVAYGLLLPKPILDTPLLGCLNLHGSLLPRWRGAAPIQRAVMAGDPETGIMVMRMDEGLDTGPIALIERVPIAPDDTAGDLHDRLAPLGADLMARALAALERDSLTFTPQPTEGVTYAAKIDKAETRIDWSRPAAEIHNQVRGLSPFPGAWSEMTTSDGPVRVKVLRTAPEQGSGPPGTLLDDRGTIACGTDALRLVRVQRAGKAAVSAADFLRGLRTGPDSRFS